jgi:hypothetical protein
MYDYLKIVVWKILLVESVLDADDAGLIKIIPAAEEPVSCALMAKI